MRKDLIQLVKSANNIPQKLGNYYFEQRWINDDGSVQLRYESDSIGYFTLTLYAKQEQIPENLESDVVLREFEECIASVFAMEDEHYYLNVQLLINEPLLFTNEKEPSFLSAVFSYAQAKEEGGMTEKISFLFLRSNEGVFNKIRFSIAQDNYDAAVGEIEGFLFDWLHYIAIIGEVVH